MRLGLFAATLMVTGMAPPPPSTPLELVSRLAAEPEHDPATLGDRLGLALREAAAHPNRYYAIYEAEPASPSWLSRIELRRARYGNASLLVLELEPASCVPDRTILARYGQPGSLQPPSPHGGARIISWLYQERDQEISFGLVPADGGFCLARVVLDRVRERCLERVTIESSTQAQIGDDVRIGAGSLWEGDYEDATGAPQHGLSAGLWISVRQRPDEVTHLRVGPGSRFTAGGNAFRVETVEARAVTLCRMAEHTLP